MQIVYNWFLIDSAKVCLISSFIFLLLVSFHPCALITSGINESLHKVLYTTSDLDANDLCLLYHIDTHVRQFNTRIRVIMIILKEQCTID